MQRYLSWLVFEDDTVEVRVDYWRSQGLISVEITSQLVFELILYVNLFPEETDYFVFNLVGRGANEFAKELFLTL